MMTVTPMAGPPLQPAFSAKRGMWRLATALSAVILSASAMLAGGAAAQVKTPGVATDNPSTQVPSDGSSTPGQPLSDRLSKSQGVITPPSGIDPGIHAPAPEPDPKTTPVIPPPAGADPSIQPK